MDTLLHLGILGFVLMFIWLVILPLIYIRRIYREKKATPLVRLFIRIWLFALFTSAMESIFFENGSLLWVSLLIAVFGFRLQAVAEQAGEKQNGEMETVRGNWARSSAI